MRRRLEVFYAAGRPLECVAVVVHDAADAAAEPALAVVARIAGRAIEVVKHAQVVTNLVSEDLNIKLSYNVCWSFLFSLSLSLSLFLFAYISPCLCVCLSPLSLSLLYL